MNNKDLLLKLDKARWWLLTHQSFYGQLAMGLSDEINETLCKTACTDGRRIFWHPEFLSKLSEGETAFVLCHEVMHCAHGHLWRLPSGDYLAQMACDYAINLILSSLPGPGIKTPEHALLDTRWRGMAEETIYHALRKEREEQQSSSGEQGDAMTGNQAGNQVSDTSQDESNDDDDGEQGADSDNKDSEPECDNAAKTSASAGQKQTEGPPDPGACGAFTSPAQDGKESLRQEWEQKLIMAAQTVASTRRGSIPADMRRIIDSVLTPKIDWRSELIDFVQHLSSYEPDWSRPSRRMTLQPVIYPREREDSIGTIVCVRDTSGSVSRSLCSEFTALIGSLIQEMRCDVILLDCDCQVWGEYRLSYADELPDTASGGGGTDFTPAFERTQQLIDSGEDIAGLIYLTDLDGAFPSRAPEYPVLWVTNTDREAPFGRVLRISK